MVVGQSAGKSTPLPDLDSPPADRTTPYRLCMFRRHVPSFCKLPEEPSTLPKTPAYLQLLQLPLHGGQGRLQLAGEARDVECESALLRLGAQAEDGGHQRVGVGQTGGALLMEGDRTRGVQLGEDSQVASIAHFEVGQDSRHHLHKGKQHSRTGGALASERTSSFMAQHRYM